MDDRERAFCIFIFYIFLYLFKDCRLPGWQDVISIGDKQAVLLIWGGGWFNPYSLSTSQVKSIWLTGCLCIHYSVICMSA